MTPQDQQQNTIQQVGGADTVREQDKIMLVLSYLPCLLPLIPLLTVKDSDYVKWHAKQGLVLTLGLGVISVLLGFIPVVGMISGCVIFVGGLVLMILGITKSFKGERWRIPVVADLADKF